MKNREGKKGRTNRTVKEEPEVDKLLIKQLHVELSEREIEETALFKQQEENCPTLFNEQRLEIVSRRACVSSPSTMVIAIISTTTPTITCMVFM